jgi:FixJ family two-component response regulator
MASSKVLHLVAVVEDDAQLRRAAQSLLRSAGYRTQGFASAEAYLQSRRAADAHCLLLDQQLPGMDGHRLIELLAARGRLVPVILVTANEERARKLRAKVKQGRVLTVLRKPYHDRALLNAVLRACRGAARPPSAP